MIRKFVLGGVVLLSSLAGLTAAFVLWGVYERPHVAGTEPVLFRVETGESFAAVTRRLGDRGLIAHRKPLALYAGLRRLDRRIKVGTYGLQPGTRPKDILYKLVTGDVYKVPVTIPEGFMHSEIAGALAAAAAVDSVAFASLLRDSTLLAEFGIEGPSLEGYLFPDTYVIPWDSPAREIAAVMVRRLSEVLDRDVLARAERLGMTRRELLTLASIVEAETRLPEELPLVSAVYHNRLQKGMRLEADPTVAYAMGGYRGRLLFRDLAIDSPYNTYQRAGLPPGPICNPGEAAIRAALEPDSTCKAIYFVARGDGSHVFSLNLRDHRAAVREARRARLSSQ
ncbi:MAG: endolytic transglycosylase MltG [Candidatus Krumholzibacteriia bacterium]